MSWLGGWSPSMASIRVACLAVSTKSTFCRAESISTMFRPCITAPVGVNPAGSGVDETAPVITSALSTASGLTAPTRPFTESEPVSSRTGSALAGSRTPGPATALAPSGRTTPAVRSAPTGWLPASTTAIWCPGAATPGMSLSRPSRTRPTAPVLGTPT